MPIKDETPPRVTLEAFLEAEHLTVTVRERAGELRHRYFATCHDVAVKVAGDRLRWEVGEGPTREAAVLAYAARLAGRVVVVGDGEPTRRELQCPSEWEG